MLVTNQTAADYWFGPLHLPAGVGQQITVDDTTATSLYLTDDTVADAINNLYASGKVTVASAADPFPRPTGVPSLLHGDGSPEGLLYAPQGSIYMRRDGAASTVIYVKTTGITVNTGWASVATGSGFGRGTTLPTNPGDGDEFVLVADAANGVLWHLKYNAGSASAYKWEYVGGTPLHHAIDTDETTGSTTYADLATVGPTLTVSHSGEYLVRYQARPHFNGGWTGSGNQIAYASISIAGVAAVDADALGGVTIDTTGEYDSFAGGFVREMKRTLAATNVAIMKYRCNGSNGNPAFKWRLLEIMPIRIS